MMRFSFILLVVSFFSIIYPGEGIAMRFPPKDVKPVIHSGIKYTAPHWAYQHGGKQNGGYIEAWGVDSGEKLWSLKVYAVKYNPSIEPDVQDVFITSLSIESDKLIVINEKNEIYEVDLITNEVVKRQR